jgi:chemotaxis protein MotB
MNARWSILRFFLVLTISMAVSGCAIGFYKGRPGDQRTIEELKDELSRLRSAESTLEQQLREDIDSDKVSLKMEDRGLVITFVAEILFDSGKAKLKPEGIDIIEKVASVISAEAAYNEIGVEGHTDNIPITYSRWESNWELSTARATSVVHYLVNECGLSPQNLSATGYGEYRPVAPNSTEQGRQANRRVEIIIKPLPDTAVSYSHPAQDSDYIK